ncbi:MAG: helix-turn-helix transcriptional regulator [bacterium]
MGRLKRESLTGLPRLGARLREIREAAGLSQTKVAELMGFNPTHGYKYILKIEKGTVPNPTLRTIVSFLEVCGADWPGLADALPHAGFKSGARPRPTEPPEPTARPAAPARPATGAPARCRRRDPRPLRVRLRDERLAERERRAQELWTAVNRAESAAGQLLRSAAPRTGRHREYLAFVRPCCATLQAFASARPKVIENELSRLTDAAVKAGLDRALLAEITRLCRESLAAAGS